MAQSSACRSDGQSICLMRRLIGCLSQWLPARRSPGRAVKFAIPFVQFCNRVVPEVKDGRWNTFGHNAGRRCPVVPSESKKLTNSPVPFPKRLDAQQQDVTPRLMMTASGRAFPRLLPALRNVSSDHHRAAPSLAGGRSARALPQRCRRRPRGHGHHGRRRNGDNRVSASASNIGGDFAHPSRRQWTPFGSYSDR
jgi:hypothetical protein